MKSGNSVTTSMRIPSRDSLPVRRPVEHDASGIQLDFHDSFLHERNPVFLFAPHDHHRPGRRRAEVIDTSRATHRRRRPPRALRGRSVVLTGCRRRHFAAPHAQLQPHLQARLFRRLDALRAWPAHPCPVTRPASTSDRRPSDRRRPSCQVVVIENVVDGLGVRLDLDPALDAERAGDLAQNDDPVRAESRRSR